MYPNCGVSPVDLSRFPACRGVFDVVYNPARTALLLQAESLGIPHAGGLHMSREVTDAVPTAIHSGCTYVPLEFFREFFNDTAFVNGVITISPSTCELENTNPSAIGG